MDESDHHPSQHQPSQDQVQAQMLVQQEEGQSSWKKQKADRTPNTNTLAEDEKISAAKPKMRKLPLQQKVIKNVEIKRLQQEMQTLCEQEKSREAEVEAFQ